MTMTAGETEVFDLSMYEFEPEVICDWVGCEATALGFLICGICQLSHEAECPQHRAYSLDRVLGDPMYEITFSESCNHKPLYLACRWEPITY